MRHIVALGLSAMALMLCQAGKASAQVNSPEVPREAHDEAQRSLPVIRKIVTPDTYKKLGFLSYEEVDRATLGSPVRVFMVRLDRLREYRPETKSSDLLEDTHEVRYPLEVNGEARNSLVMRQIDGKWQVAKFGRPTLTKTLTDVVHKRMAENRASAETFFEVKIPALNLDFVGRDAGSRILLTSTADDSRFDIREGEELDAQQLFARVAPYARDLKTGPNLAN